MPDNSVIQTYPNDQAHLPQCQQSHDVAAAAITRPQDFILSDDALL